MSKKEIQRLLKEQEKMQSALDKQAEKIKALEEPNIYRYHVRYLIESTDKIRELAMLNAAMDAMLRKANEEPYSPSRYIQLKEQEKMIQGELQILFWRRQEKREPDNQTYFLRPLR